MGSYSEMINQRLKDIYVHDIMLQEGGLFTPSKNARMYDFCVTASAMESYKKFIENSRTYKMPRGLSRGYITLDTFFDETAIYGSLFASEQPEFPLILPSIPSFVKYITDVQPTGFAYLDLVNELLSNTEIHNMLKKYIRENPYETRPTLCSGMSYSDSVTDMRSVLNNWNGDKPSVIKTVKKKRRKKKGK